MEVQFSRQIIIRIRIFKKNSIRLKEKTKINFRNCIKEILIISRVYSLKSILTQILNVKTFIFSKKRTTTTTKFMIKTISYRFFRVMKPNYMVIKKNV